MSNDKYSNFNKFQTYFYTDIKLFNNFTNFEIKENIYMLLNNILKGFPHLADELYNLYSPDVKAIESPEIIKALQHKFVNNFTRPRVPQYIFYKNFKETKKASSKKIKKGEKEYLEFSNEIKMQLKSILFIDSKDFEFMKYTDKIQKLGKELVEQNEILISKKVIGN